VTRHNKSPAFTIEKLAHDCIDVRELRRMGLFSGDWVSFRPVLRWPAIALVRAVRYAIQLDLRGHTTPNEFASLGRGFISVARGHGCTVPIAKSASHGSTADWEAISVAAASATPFTPAKP